MPSELPQAAPTQPLRSGDSPPSGWTSSSKTPKRRNGWWVLTLSLVSVGVYAIAWLTLLQREHPRRTGIDPPAWAWLCTWLGFGVLMFAALILSGFGEWQQWHQADQRQQWLFAAALFVAVLFNVWFGFGCLRLTDRFAALMGDRLTPVRGKLTRIAVILGIAFEMVAMLMPLLARVQLIDLPDNILVATRVVQNMGTGSLLAWSISIHRQANVLAQTPSTDSTQSSDSIT